MATQLLQEFPELSKLSYVSFTRSWALISRVTTWLRREDLEDLLVDQQYFQATFFSLDKVKTLLQSQGELGAANETLARELSPS